MSPLPATDAEAEDLAALRATAAGDRAAFEALYRRHFGRLARFLRRFTDRVDLREDVINRAMWVVWSQAATFRAESKVSTWITGIAYRCMLKALRDGGNPDEVSETLLPGDPLEAATDSRPERELCDWVQKGLALLPDDLRTTMELAYLLGLSCAEIATVMDCAEGTVKARMFNARLRLRNLMPALGGITAAKA